MLGFKLIITFTTKRLEKREVSAKMSMTYKWERMWNEVILTDINVEGSEKDKNCNQKSQYSKKGPNSEQFKKRTGNGQYS